MTKLFYSLAVMIGVASVSLACHTNVGFQASNYCPQVGVPVATPVVAEQLTYANEQCETAVQSPMVVNSGTFCNTGLGHQVAAVHYGTFSVRNHVSFGNHAVAFVNNHNVAVRRNVVQFRNRNVVRGFRANNAPQVVVRQRGGLLGRRNQVVNVGGGAAVRVEQRGGLFGLGILGRRQSVTVGAGGGVRVEQRGGLFGLGARQSVTIR